MRSSAPSRSSRRDAVRNRDRIVVAARAALAAGRPLHFNDVANDAHVGVGTVYRHFASSEALREAAVLDRLGALLAVQDEPLDGHDPWDALAAFLRHAVAAQRAEPALTEVIAQPIDALDETTEVRAALTAIFERRLGAAAEAGLLREGVTAADVNALLCGIAYAGRAAGPNRDDLYFEVLLAGLRAP